MRYASVFFILFAAGVSAHPILNATNFSDAPSKHILVTPIDDCNGVWLRATSGAQNSKVWYNDCVKALKTNGVGGAYHFGDAQKGHLLANTDLSTAAQLTIVAMPAKNSGEYTCDHILELQILKAVLNQDKGVCEQAAKMKDQEAAKKKILAIRKIVNGANNLVFAQNSFEDVKGRATQVYTATNLLPGKPAGTDLEFLAMENYLTKTEVKSLATAQALDAEIKKQFPSAPTGVEKKWAAYLAEVKAVAVIVKADAEKQIKALQQAAEQNAAKDCGTSAPGSGTTTTTTTRRMVPLLPRGLSNVSRLPPNGLQRRVVRGAARSGPHAPPAPSCPVPGAKQKKVVPRKDMKVKPPPATAPRVPTRKPVAKKPVPKKVVPRPASRPRRVPGKAAPPPKRVTPKKKPKRVPKPAQKPVGKPRPRRR